MLKGVNFGSWLNPEGYILGGRNISFHHFRKNFVRSYTSEELKFLNQSFINNYITDFDFAKVASWGVNVIRVPFHYLLIEKVPFVYDDAGIDILKGVLDAAERNGLKVILDLHAACGAQNADWHSDSIGKAYLWEIEDCRERTYAMWEYIAKTFKGHKALAGYDILNEPVLSEVPLKKLMDFYTNCIKMIRNVDKNVKIFIEGHNWSQDIDFLVPLLDKNIVVSIHTYQPLNFVFNFRRGYFYPGNIDNEEWNIDKIREHLRKYKDFSDRNNTEIFVGEFGINFRNNAYGEVDYLDDLLTVFDEYGFHWTYWTYKCVAQSVFPDGIMQYEHNPPWIRREGPEFGFENIYSEWDKNKHDIIASWRTEHFTENNKIVDVLTKHF